MSLPETNDGRPPGSQIGHLYNYSQCLTINTSTLEPMKKYLISRPSDSIVAMCLLSATGLAAISSSVFASKGPVSTIVSEDNSHSSVSINSAIKRGADNSALSDWEGTVVTLRSELTRNNASSTRIAAEPGGSVSSSTQDLSYASVARDPAQSSWSDFESSVLSFTATAPSMPKTQIVAPKASVKIGIAKPIQKKQIDSAKRSQTVNLAVSAATADSARALQSADNVAISSESTLKQIRLLASSIESTLQAVPTIAAVQLLRIAVPNFEGLTEEIPSTLEAEVKPVNETILCPVTNSIVTSDYGMRIHPITGRRHLHNGVDFAAEKNQPVHALLDGTVVKCGRRGALGIAVEIYHPSVDKSTIVGHLNGVAVKKGEVIKQNQVIGYAGSTGRSTGVHVHFMVGGADGYEDPNNFLAWLTENRTALANGELANLPTIVRPARKHQTIVVAAADEQSSAVKVKPVKVKSHGRVVAASSSTGTTDNTRERAYKVAYAKNNEAMKKNEAAVMIAANVKRTPKVTEAQIEAARDTLTEKQRLAEMFEYLYKEGAVSRNQAQEQVAQVKKAQEMVQDLEASRNG